MGAGKTTWASSLPKCLNARFTTATTKSALHRAYPFRPFFEMEGGRRLPQPRNQYAEKKLASRHNIVLSTGGGSVLRSETDRFCAKTARLFIYMPALKPCWSVPVTTATGRCCKLPILWPNCKSCMTSAIRRTVKPPISSSNPTAATKRSNG